MANGNYSYILDRGFVTYNEDGTAIKMIGAMMNFTDKKEKEMRLLELSSKLHSVVEEERSHLAREIHDELGQQLTLLKLELNRIKKFLPEKPEEALKHLNHSLETVTGSIKSVKNLSFELHPQLIRELGLNEALERYMQNFSQRSGLKCILHIADDFNCNNESTSLTIYRIVQEALSNVIRHAKATKAQVKIESTKHQWLISIEDNGTGMTEKSEDNFSLGLTGMKERAHMINAELEIISNAGGTKINIVIPIR
jgi:signal transduction histidine kinase